MPYKDIEKRRESQRRYAKAYYERNKHRPEFKQRVRDNDARQNKRRLAVVSKFRSQGCKVCGEADQCCLQAHHLDPTTKEHNITDMVRLGYSPEKIKTELEKCVCLCANCHFKTHAHDWEVTSNVGRETLENQR